METADVRRRVQETIERARREAAARRLRTDDAARDYAAFLEIVAVPLFRQVAGALKAAGYPFAVFTPGGGVRLMSDKAANDYIELSLETSGSEPTVMGKVSRTRGRRTIETETPVAEVPVRELTEELLLRFLLQALGPFVER
jgi:hypothetical protein